MFITHKNLIDLWFSFFLKINEKQIKNMITFCFDSIFKTNGRV